jgi:hypothetical protein
MSRKSTQRIGGNTSRGMAWYWSGLFLSNLNTIAIALALAAGCFKNSAA